VISSRRPSTDQRLPPMSVRALSSRMTRSSTPEPSSGPGEGQLSRRRGEFDHQPVGAALARQVQQEQQRSGHRPAGPAPDVGRLQMHDPRGGIEAARPGALALAGESRSSPRTRGSRTAPADPAPAATSARRPGRSAGPAAPPGQRPAPQRAAPRAPPPPSLQLRPRQRPTELGRLSSQGEGSDRHVMTPRNGTPSPQVKIRGARRCAELPTGQPASATSARSTTWLRVPGSSVFARCRSVSKSTSTAANSEMSTGRKRSPRSSIAVSIPRSK
jgi:hypothetical protein